MVGITMTRNVFAVVVVAAGVVTAPASPAPSVGAQVLGVRLTGGQGSLGNGVALIMGPSLISTPSQRYVETVDSLFLQPRGFTGTAVPLTTPESPSYLGESEAQGAQILTTAIQSEIASGHADAANPVVVFGYSQSAAFVTFTMEQLHAHGVPSDDVHFVLVGDPANPSGGLLTGIDVPPGTTIPVLDIPLGNPTPGNLYPVDVYTLEYDGFADAPHYPIDPLAWANTFMGLALVHTAYLGLDSQQVADAVPLATTGDTLASYYVIPSENLPLLDPLQWIPVIGAPLYDLLEPVTQILVNQGYGSITDGWNQGPANLPTPDALFPASLNGTELLTALGNAATSGLTAFAEALVNSQTYQLTPLTDNPSLSAILTAAYAVGLVNTPHPSSMTDVIDAFLATFFQSMFGLTWPSPADDVPLPVEPADALTIPFTFEI
ncbi:MAG TPA: PE-PPE domain-containing protein [Mycobacterium sp.]|nr:PE-PPE domain-containing protein [Mycobacterium sp.]